MGRRERKKRQTRERLTDAALELFDQHGYDATTVAMIAEKAGVSARTFFRYFDTKHAVLAEPGSRFLAAAALRLGDVPARDRGVTALVEAMVGLLEDDDAFSSATTQAWRTRSDSELREPAAIWRQRWASELAQLLADMDGRSQPTFHDRAVCSAAVTVMKVAFDEWFRLDGHADVGSLARQAATAVCGDTGPDAADT